MPATKPIQPDRPRCTPRMTTVYADAPKNAAWPNDRGPVYPIRRSRLIAKIANTSTSAARPVA